MQARTAQASMGPRVATLFKLDKGSFLGGLFVFFVIGK